MPWVLNLNTKKVWAVPDGHFALTSPDFSVLPGKPGEDAKPAPAGEPKFEEWTADELLAYASEQAIDVGRATSPSTLARRIREALDER